MKHALQTCLAGLLWLCCLHTAVAQITTTTLVASGTPWKYYDKAATPPVQGTATWFSTAFDDNAAAPNDWLTGNSPLGYAGTGSPFTIATTISFGSDPNNKFTTAYFRKTVNVADVSTYSSYTVRYKKDDAIVLYVNGIEIKRENLPTTAITFSTTATANIADATNNTYVTVTLPNGAIRPGNNVIAAEVHQFNATSSDLLFDFDLVANANQTTLAATPLPIVSTSAAVWKVLDNGIDQGTAWTAAAFNDSYWKQISPTGSPARLHYGETGAPNIPSAWNKSAADPFQANNANYISCGLDANNKYPTTYFRKKISIADVSQFAGFDMRIMRDDAPVVYVNGVEVYRDNIGTGTVTFLTSAASTIDAAEETNFNHGRYVASPDAGYNSLIPASAFVNGENIIAVEMHQRAPLSSSDLTFNMTLTGVAAGNLPPTVANTIPNQTGNQTAAFTYTIPANTFTDPEGQTLVLTASGLPTGLSMTTAGAITGTITGASGPSTVTITATDPGGAFVTTTFTITVGAAVPTLVRGPYLQKGMMTGMTIKWRTSVACVGEVKFGPSAGALTGTVTEAAATTEHSVAVSGLTAQTQYFYSIGVAGGATLQGDATNYFYTFPTEGSTKKIRIWSLGDHGSGTTRQTQVKTAFKNYVAGLGDPYIDLWLWMGDNAYNSGTETEFQNNVFSYTNAWALGSERVIKQTPIYATPGNHDHGNASETARVNHNSPYYDIMANPTNAEAGGVASGKEEYYSFNYGNVHFVSLDSDGREGAGTAWFDNTKPQIDWLKRDLAAAQANPNNKWIIVWWHQPPYSLGTHNTDTDLQCTQVRQNLLPVLEQYRVDMVMCGHSHVYERSKLMKGHFGISTTFDSNTHNPVDNANAKSSALADGSANSCYYFKSSTTPGPNNEGTVYVVNGHGGQSTGGRVTTTSTVGGLTTGVWPHKAMQTAIDVPQGGSMYIEVEGGKLTSVMIGGDGTIVDKFTMIKDGDTFGTPATDNTSRAAACECTDADGMTHYTDNAGTTRLLAVKKNGQNIGRVGDGTLTMSLQGAAGASFIAKNAPTNYVSNPAGWWVMNRYWTLNPTTEPTAPVTVRYFYTDADLAAVNSNLATPLMHSQLKMLKINDVSTNFDVNPANGQTTIPLATAYNTNGAWVYKNGPTPSTTDWAYTNLGGGRHAADMLVGHFGGGGGGGASGGESPLPVTLSYFGGRMTNTGALLEWATAMERDNAGFRILRGTDAISFEPVGTVASRGVGGNSGISLSYRFVDGQPLPGVNYYRLQQTDHNGRQSLSKIVALSLDNATPVLYPNPVGSDGRVWIVPPMAYDSYQLHDAAGRLVMDATAPGTLSELTLDSRVAGVYVLSIIKDGQKTTFRIVRG